LQNETVHIRGICSTKMCTFIKYTEWNCTYLPCTQNENCAHLQNMQKCPKFKYLGKSETKIKNISVG
jgi:hypothetical protein